MSKRKQPKYYPGETAFAVDHSKYDPLDEEFFQRNKIPTSNQFNKAKSNLREANQTNQSKRSSSNPLSQMRRNQFQNKTNKHILKYQQTENDMIDVKYDEDGEILAMSINLNVDGEMNPDDLKDFNQQFAQQIGDLLAKEGREKGLKTLMENQLPTATDLRSPNFSLSAFYNQSKKESRFAQPVDYEQLETHDLDSNDLTTDGVNPQIQVRNLQDRLKQKSAKPEQELLDGYESNELRTSQIRAEVGEIALDLGGHVQPHSTAKDGNSTAMTDTDYPDTDHSKLDESSNPQPDLPQK